MQHAGEGDNDNAGKGDGKGDTGKGDTGKGASPPTPPTPLEAELDAILTEAITAVEADPQQVADPQTLWVAVRKDLETAQKASTVVDGLLSVAMANGDLGVAISRVKGGRKGGKGGVDAGKGDKKGTMIVAKGDKGGSVDAGKGDNHSGKDKDGKGDNHKGDNHKDGKGGQGGKGGKDKVDEVETEMFLKGNISCPHCLSTVSIFTKFKVDHPVRSYPYPPESWQGSVTSDGTIPIHSVTSGRVFTAVTSDD